MTRALRPALFALKRATSAMRDEHIRPIIEALPVWNERQINELIMYVKYYVFKEDFHNQRIQNPESRTQYQEKVLICAPTTSSQCQEVQQAKLNPPYPPSESEPDIPIGFFGINRQTPTYNMDLHFKN